MAETKGLINCNFNIKDIQTLIVMLYKRIKFNIK